MLTWCVQFSSCSCLYLIQFSWTMNRQWPVDQLLVVSIFLCFIGSILILFLYCFLLSVATDPPPFSKSLTSVWGSEVRTAPSILSHICLSPGILNALGISLFDLEASSFALFASSLGLRWCSCSWGTTSPSDTGMLTSASTVSCSIASLFLDAESHTCQYPRSGADLSVTGTCVDDFHVSFLTVGSRYISISSDKSSQSSAILIRGVSLIFSSVP